MTEVVGFEPTLFALRGNTAVGRLCAIKTVAGIGQVIADLEPGGHPTINPDYFKVDLINHDRDLALTASQVHVESWVLAERIEARLLGGVDRNGRPPSLILDGRFGRFDEVEVLRIKAERTGRRFCLYDVDASLEDSLVGVLLRDPAEPADGPRPPFHAIADGFVVARHFRADVIDLFLEDPGIGSYTLLRTTGAGAKVTVATVEDGFLDVFDEQLFTLATSEPRARHVGALARAPITYEFIGEYTRRLDRTAAERVSAALSPYADAGTSWGVAVDEHFRKPTQFRERQGGMT